MLLTRSRLDCGLGFYLNKYVCKYLQDDLLNSSSSRFSKDLMADGDGQEDPLGPPASVSLKMSTIVYM